MEQALEAGAAVVLLTATRPWQRWAELSTRAPLLLVVHKASLFFAGSGSGAAGWSGLRQLRSALAGDNYWRQQLLTQTAVLGFPTSAMRQYCQEQGWVSLQKKAVITPFAFFEGSDHPLTGTLRIVIPGTVKENGRNYATVLSALEQVGPLLRRRVELWWLGAAQGRRGQQILRPFLSLDRYGIEVIYHRQPLDDAAYAAVLASADFLVLPLAGEIQVEGYDLPNGFAGISGTRHDQLRFGLPALLDAAYPPCPHLAPLTQRYRNANELAAGLLNWIRTQDYRTLRAMAPQYLVEWNRPRIQQVLLGALQEGLGRFSYQSDSADGC